MNALICLGVSVAVVIVVLLVVMGRAAVRERAGRAEITPIRRLRR